MKLIRKLLRDRKGISLTEVVIAMAAVLMVTGAAISVLISSNQADIAFRDKYRGLTGCENAVECLRFATDNELSQAEVATILEKAGFVDETPEDTEVKYILEGNEEVTVTYDIEADRYVVKYRDEIIYTKN